jgi:hypothetical protein
MANIISDADTIKNNDPRKATEIVLSIEEKLSTLMKVMYSYDLNVKLVLDRTNKIYKYIERLEETERQLLLETEQVPEADQHTINIPAGEKITEAKELVEQRRTSRVSMPVDNTLAKQNKQAIQVPTNTMSAVRQSPAEAMRQVSSQQSTHSTDTDATIAPVQASSGRKIPVMQRITDDKGKDVFMAEITIVGSDKEVAAKTKTSAVGKWQAQLRPGKYTVNIVKTNTTMKTKTEVSQSIDIPNSNTPITLPVAILKR